MDIAKSKIHPFVIKDSKPVVIGGTMRIPLLKRILLSHFSSNVSLPMIFDASNEDFTGLIQTLNMDESAACGSCVYQIAKNISFSFNKPYEMNGSTSLKLDEATHISKSAESKIQANENIKKTVILRNEIEAQLYIVVVYFIHFRYEHQHEIESIRIHIDEADSQLIEKLEWLKNHKTESYEQYNECFEEVNEYKFLNSVDVYILF